MREILLFILVLVCLLLAPFFGASGFWGFGILGVGSSLSPQDSNLVFWQLRVPRVLLGFLVGAGLGLGGVVFQSLFCNPLATPYTLGVASAAAFAAILAMFCGLPAYYYGLPLHVLSGLLGALLGTAIVFYLGQLRRYASAESLLLLGVALGFFFSSLILVFQYLSDPGQSLRMVRWLMGGLETVGYGAILLLAPPVLLACAVIYCLRRELDLLTLGEEVAQSRGLDPARVRGVLIIVTSMMIGAVVSQVGPIGFVGMMVPHLCRRLLGPLHAKLIPFALMCSGAFLVVCDALGRSAFAPLEVPVGVVTALLGAPVFVMLLIGER